MHNLCLPTGACSGNCNQGDCLGSVNASRARKASGPWVGLFARVDVLAGLLDALLPRHVLLSRQAFDHASDLVTSRRADAFEVRHRLSEAKTEHAFTGCRKLR